MFFLFFLVLKPVKQANKQNWNPGCLCSLSEIKWKENPPISPSLSLPNFSSQGYPTSNAIGGNWKYVSLFTKGKPQILWIIHIKNNYTWFCSHLLYTSIYFQWPQVLQLNVYFCNYCISTHKHTRSRKPIFIYESSEVI